MPVIYGHWAPIREGHDLVCPVCKSKNVESRSLVLLVKGESVLDEEYSCRDCKFLWISEETN